LLAGQEASQFADIGFDGLGHLGYKLAAVLDRGRRPRRKSGLGRGDGRIELAFRSTRALRQHFLGRGIEDGHRLVAGNHLPVDQKVEIVHWLALPFERTPLEVSLYSAVYHDFDRQTTASAARQPA